MIEPPIIPEEDRLWRHFLFDTRTMADIGELDFARDRNLTVSLNRAGAGTLSITLEEEIAALVEKHRTGVRWVRKDEPVWGGPVYTLDEDAAANRLNIGCLGWFEELEHRQVRAGQEKTFTRQPQDVVIYALLEMANSQRDGLPRVNEDGTNGTGKLRPTKVVEGAGNAQGGFPPISISFERGQKIGEQIRQITDNENGPDMDVHPVARELDLWHPRRGVDSNVVLMFGEDMLGENLENLVRQMDGGQMTNRLTVYGDNGSVGMAEDTESMDYWSVMFEDERSVSGLATSESARDFAGAEVAVLKDPKITFAIAPLGTPEGDDHPVPALFEHFNVGDTVKASAERGRLQVDGQRIRIFGASLTIEDNDNEKLSSIDLSPSS